MRSGGLAMSLTKHKLGELIQLSDTRNESLQYNIENVKGISIQKRFIETKADMSNVSLRPYFLVKPDFFAYVTVTSRNGEKITIAHNDTEETYIVSSSYVVFYITKPDILLSDYLFMLFNRPEFDRYTRFNSWGSAREFFLWEYMCDIDIELPNIETQQKYVDIYRAIVSNQQSYERGIENLRLVSEGFLNQLKQRIPFAPIGQYLELSEEKNISLSLGIDAVKGISIEKKFIDTKADMSGVNLSPYYLVEPNNFAYVTVTSRNGEKISIALNDSDNTYLCSSSYVVFKSKNEEKLLPQYLMLHFSRPEFDRYARFNSWGSARETFDWSELCKVEIPIPDITIQKSIADMYNTYLTRQRINEKLKAQIKDICPILIRGSLLDGDDTQ